MHEDIAVQMDAEVISDDFLCWMLGGEMTGTKMQVKGKMPNKYFSMKGTFGVSNEDGTETVKEITFKKAKPQPNADLTLNATEVSSFTLTWDIMVDDNDLILELDNKTA